MRCFRLCLLVCLAAVLVILFQSGFLFSETQTAPHGILFSDQKGVKSFDYGDANGDGVIDVGDVVHLINYLFKGGPDPNPLEAGDANCDLIVDVGDVVWLINYLFKGGEPPPCFSPSDSFDPDSLESQLQMLSSSICDTGRTDVVWLTPVAPTYDVFTETQGDTAIEHSLCFFGTDDGTYMRFPPPRELTSDESQEQELKQGMGDWSSDFGSYGSTYLPNAQYRPQNGAPWESRGIQINGNTVMVGNNYFTFDDPSPLDPSLGRMVLDKKYDPPPALTAQQISTACGEGALSIANCRIISAFYTKLSSWWAGSSTHCVRTESFHFLFEHAWVYDCPHGPQRRHHLAIFEGSTSLVCNGTQIYHTSFSAIYYRILQTM
ncbi:MAG: dockerin type I repeat-containing protein [Candidatus Zixiibacteriota bacterium]